ncbi:MAG: hypothetical protein LIO57_00820 [Oscillospiraceae bacterium]|nr:hypothetical protein [Oscillospiraceae bacterium]
MSELETKLHELLNNPAELEKLTSMASQLMGGSAAGSSADGGAEGGLLGNLSSLLSGAGLSAAPPRQPDKTEVLRSIAAYLAPQRREKLEKAIRLAQVARVASFALGERGGENDV